MVSELDITFTIIVSIVYLMILPIQLVIFPMQYYSIKDVVYSRSLKKATGALVSRFCFITAICFIAWLIDRNNKSVIYGITIGSFLCAWPSIYHYQLFAFIKNKYKLLYFVACLTSVYFSWACASFAMKELMPMLFDNKGFYLIDNSGIQTIITIIGFGGPIGVRQIMQKDERDNPYLVADTFSADLYLTKRKMTFMKEFINQYTYEIALSAEKYGISSELLKTVIQLEIINRHSLYFRFAEKLCVRFFPGILIHKDSSIGLTQIKISNARDYFHMAPRRYIADMLKPEVSIELCAYMLKKLLDEYDEYNFTEDEVMESFYDDPNITEDYILSVYLASRYICGEQYVLNKYVMVYAAIISETYPATREEKL